MYANRMALSLALTQQFELTLSAKSATPAAINAALATPTPLVTPPVLVACETHNDDGFALSLLSDSPLVADGRSSRVVTVRTCDSNFVGREINFIVDGGRLNPQQVILPAVGDTVPVEYTTGLSAGEIVIIGVVSDGFNEYRDEVRLNLVGEPVVLLGDYDRPVTVNPLAIPIELHLVNPVTGADTSGEYMVRVYGDSNGRVMLAGGNPADSVDMMFIGNRTASQVYYLPNADVTRGVIQAYLVGRSDVPPFEAVLFWDNLTERLLFSQNWLAEQRGLSRDLSFWDTSLEYPLCLLALDANLQAIVPNWLQLRIQANPTTQMLTINGANASEGRWLQVGDQIPRTTLNAFSENCLTLTMPADTVHQAAGLHLEAAAERARISDDIYIFAHQGAFELNIGAAGLTLTLNQADMPGMPGFPGVLTLPPNMTLTVYRDKSRSQAETVAYLMLWVDANLLDMEQNVLRSNMQPISLFAGSSEQPNQIPVLLTLQADTSVLLLDTLISPTSKWQRVALLVTIPQELVPTPSITVFPAVNPISSTNESPLMTPPDWVTPPTEGSPVGIGNER